MYCLSAIAFRPLLQEERRALGYTMNYQPRWANQIPTLLLRLSQSSENMLGQMLPPEVRLVLKNQSNRYVLKVFWSRRAIMSGKGGNHNLVLSDGEECLWSGNGGGQPITEVKSPFSIVGVGACGALRRFSQEGGTSAPTCGGLRAE